MIQPVKRGAELLDEINRAECPTPNLWWLGHCGFAIKFQSIVFYVDPYLSDSQEERFRRSDRPHERLTEAPLAPLSIRHADMLLTTHAHGAHLDPGSAPHILHSSRSARIVLPKSAAGKANSIGIDYKKMTTTDADLRVEFFKDGEYARVYAVPSAHEELDWTPIGGYPYLGYLVRFGDWTLYHAGDCVPFEGLVDRLKPYNVNVALLPINGRDPERGMPGNFTISEAADLAAAIGAQWLVPMHYNMFAVNNVDISRFVDHMLGHRPSQPFKVFECGERWALPS
jgi:L-ascorbate 6-phosphate lactonase